MRFDSSKAVQASKGQIIKAPEFQDKELKYHPGDHGLPLKSSGLGRGWVRI